MPCRPSTAPRGCSASPATRLRGQHCCPVSVPRSPACGCSSALRSRRRLSPASESPWRADPTPNGADRAQACARAHEPFVVADLLASQAVLGACQGISVRSYARHDLVAIGSVADTAQVLANLLANVLRYAPGSALDLRGEQDGEWITVRVEDRGPGIPPGERARLLLRGARGAAGSDVAGSGLGLYVAARLMRGQGGDLRIEDRPGGGTSVVLTLQTAPAGSVRPEGLQSLQRGGEVPGRALVEADQTNLADRRGRGLEPSDGLFGDHPGGLGARVSEDAR